MSADWLPGDVPAPDLSGLEAWKPKVVRDHYQLDEDWESLTYLVVDELLEGAVGIVATPWPRVDERGRLRFPDEDESVRLAVPLEALQEVLAQDRQPIVPIETDDATEAELRRRQVSIGDAFAARVRHERMKEADLDAWLQRPVLDVTADAREQAKVQASAAAVRGVIEEDGLLEVISDEFTEDEPRQEPA